MTLGTINRANQTQINRGNKIRMRTENIENIQWRKLMKQKFGSL